MKNIVVELEEQGILPKGRYTEAYQGKKQDTYVVRTKDLKWGIVSKDRKLLTNVSGKIQKDESENFLCAGLSGVEVFGYVLGSMDK